MTIDTTALERRLTVTAGDLVRVVALRGIPASGKSTIARAAVAAATPGTVIRLNNDDLAGMLYAGQTIMTAESAALLAGLRAGTLTAALTQPHVRLVIIDNTNLAERSLRALEQIALAHGATFEVDDTLLAVPVDVCLARDAARDKPVGETVIARMVRDAARIRPWKPGTHPQAALRAVTPYNNDPALPGCVIVDVDGTLALMVDRSPFEWHKVGSDAPNRAVVDLVRDLIDAGERIIVMSGRDGSCREQTQAWLDEHVAPGLPLYMRSAGDARPDAIIKLELFNAHIAGKHHVRFVLDDRDSVVHLWRRVLGLPTFQVADGSF